MTSDLPTNMAEMGLFSGATQHENFNRMSELAPVREMAPSSSPLPWPAGAERALPATYHLDGEQRSVEEFLVDTDTAALLVLVDGEIRHERYMLTGGPDVRWMSMSVAKSFVSALVGIAVDEGHIGGVHESISDYVPVEPGSAYDGVSIKAVLQMSSGARWNEDYSDPASDIGGIGAAMLGVDGGLDGFVARMVKESEPDTVCRYNSGETQVLGALVARATGRPLADYMQEKLVEPLGFESPGAWITDALGTEMYFAGLNLTARDFARLGELYRRGGNWNGRQVVPASWVNDSLTIDSPIREPGRPIIGDEAVGLGYGYQWWLPPGDRGEFSAIGVYNQFVYVDPHRRTTIVKLSANRRYGTSTAERDNRDDENVVVLQAIARTD
jgi:CubicO group peptidase (beta-lactamase class C family)